MLALAWAAWEQLLGSSYVILAVTILLLSALLPEARADGHDLQRGAGQSLRTVAIERYAIYLGATVARAKRRGIGF